MGKVEQKQMREVLHRRMERWIKGLNGVAESY